MVSSDGNNMGYKGFSHKKAAGSEADSAWDAGQNGPAGKCHSNNRHFAVEQLPSIDDSHGNTVELLIEARQGYDHAFLVCDKNGNDWLMADPAGYKAIDADYFAIAD